MSSADAPAAPDDIRWRPADPPPPVITFVDLDDTLFRSRARGGHGQAVTVAGDGQPAGFMSPARSRLFEVLRAAGRVIPTTARLPEQLARVRLPLHDHAICANGAILLDPAGRPCPEWRDALAARCPPAAHDARPIAELARTARDGAGMRIELRWVDGDPLMVDVRQPDRDPAPFGRWLADIGPRLPSGWAIDAGRDRALIHPRPVHKAAAVRWFIEHHAPPDALLIGAGDRPGDRGFMALCHFALLPTSSHLFEALGR